MIDDEADMAATLKDYAAPPLPPPLAQELLRNMDARMMRRNTWRKGALAATGIAAALMIGIAGNFAVMSWVRPRTPPQVGALPRQHVLTPLATAPALGLPRGRVMGLGMLSLEQQVARSPLILRARITDYHDTLVTYDVLHVVYGKTDKTVIQFDAVFHNGLMRKTFEAAARTRFTKQHGRDPTDAELLEAMMADQGIVKGREVLLLLAPVPGNPGTYTQTGSMFDVPPDHRLDDQETKILQVIEKGDYLQPVPAVGDVFEEILRQSPLVVRATLQSVNADHSVWKTVRPVHGNVDTATVTVPHTLFRRRAEALVNALAATDPKLANPQIRDAAVEKKMQALIDHEFTAGRDALLFLTDAKPEQETTTAELVARAFDNLDAMEREVQQPTGAAPL
jgi:hypothetical protein